MPETNEEVEVTKTTAPIVTPKAAAAPIPVDKFPRKRYYADGFVFNMPIHYYAERTEETIKKSLIDAGNSKEQSEKDVDLIGEALRFHEAEFKKPEEPKRG